MKYADLTEPYCWMWDKKTHFRFSYILKVIAYEARGKSSSDDIIVLMLL